MVIQSVGRKVAGIDIAPDPCPKCGKPMFKIPCKCPFRRKGWALCAKCLNPACGYQMGLVMATTGARRHMRGAFNALS